jgi:hypothetical protein
MAPWVYSFLTCSIGQKFLETFGVSKNISNIATCVTFQLYFIYATFGLTYNEIFYGIRDVIGSRDNMGYLYGYFTYDLAQLLIKNDFSNNKGYIVHHVVSCIMLDLVISKKINHTLYQNAFLLVAEVSNPLINARILLKDYPTLKRYNKSAMKYSYFCFRVILFPLFASEYLRQSELDIYNKHILAVLFAGIYSATVSWYLKIIS